MYEFAYPFRLDDEQTEDNLVDVEISSDSVWVEIRCKSTHSCDEPHDPEEDKALEQCFSLDDLA